MKQKIQGDFIYRFLFWGIIVFSGCVAPTTKPGLEIEIPVPQKRTRKKQIPYQQKKPSPRISVSAQELYVKGQRAYYQGEYEKALGMFRSAEESDPHFLEPRMARGKVLLEIGRYNKAARIFDGIIRRDSDYFAAYVGQGRALLNEKKYDKALSALKNASNLIPHHPEVEELLNDARKKSIGKHLSSGKRKKNLGDLRKAEIEFQTILKLDPQETRAHLQIAYILVGREEYRSAEEHLNAALAKEPTNANAWSLIAKVYSRTKRLGKARMAYRRLLEIDPGAQESRVHLQTVQKALVSASDVPAAFFELSSSLSTTRGELAAILSVGLEIPAQQQQREETIVDIGRHWAREYIQKVINAGLMDISSNNMFAPNTPLTREDLALIVYRILNKFNLVDKEEIKRLTNPYEDLYSDNDLFHTALYLYKTRIMTGEEKRRFGIGSEVPGIEALEVVDRLDNYLSRLREGKVESVKALPKKD